MALQPFGDLVKAVVDVSQGIMAVNGELHADEEKILLERGSRQEDLWGINIYPESTDAMIEFDSMINIRPSQDNRSRSVEDKQTQEKIKKIVYTLIQ
ncbi:hypothetical protein HY620_00500 [Candidatus Uhrbacteria bacterium]|nr:hypothetical protein [Candidatus Uhrbacteria bacterium]